MHLTKQESRFINAAMSKGSTQKALADAFTNDVPGIGMALVSTDGHRLHAVPTEASEGLRVLADTVPKGKGGAVTLVPIDSDFKPPDVSQVFPSGKPLWSLTTSPDVLTQGSGSGHVKSGFLVMAPIDGRLAMAVRVPGSPWQPLADCENAVCVDVRYLADALAGFGADNVRVECWDAYSPVRLSLASGDVGPVALVMPVRT